MLDLPQFTDRVVLITGDATGIGRAVALAFARQGATVVVETTTTGRTPPRLPSRRQLGGSTAPGTEHFLVEVAS